MFVNLKVYSNIFDIHKLVLPDLVYKINIVTWKVYRGMKAKRSESI